MRFIDIMLAFPGILLAIAIVSVLGFGLNNVIIAIGIFSIPTYARLTRGAVLSVKNLDYITSARSLGASHLRIIFRHILPNSLSPLIVQTTLRIATALLTAASLSFLGLGAQPPLPEWVDVKRRTCLHSNGSSSHHVSRFSHHGCGVSI